MTQTTDAPIDLSWYPLSDEEIRQFDDEGYLTALSSAADRSRNHAGMQPCRGLLETIVASATGHGTCEVFE